MRECLRRKWEFQEVNLPPEPSTSLSTTSSGRRDSEDRHASPAEIVAIRVDFSDWLETLTLRNRRIAEQLAVGETSGYVARMFSVSTGRISQLRRELRESWYKFTGAFDGAESFATE